MSYQNNPFFWFLKTGTFAKSNHKKMALKVTDSENGDRFFRFGVVLLVLVWRRLPWTLLSCFSRWSMWRWSRSHPHNLLSSLAWKPALPSSASIQRPRPWETRHKARQMFAAIFPWSPPFCSAVSANIVTSITAQKVTKPVKPDKRRQLVSQSVFFGFLFLIVKFK